jgi:zinc transport system substrate-binding protein
MNMRRTVIGLVGVAILACAASLAGCRHGEVPQWKGQHPHVVATIAPLACFARNVGGAHAEVKCLCTVTGPHETVFDAQESLLLRDTDVFLAVGLGLDEKFADKMYTHSNNAHLRYVKLGDSLPKDLKLHSDPDEDDKAKDKEKHEEHGEINPHVWLGLAQAKAMVAMIRDELKKADPAHADDYDANAKKYSASLDKLLADGKQQLAGKTNRKVIAFHDSLPYFAGNFGIQIAGTIELAPGDEPSAAQLARLVKLCKEQDVRVIAAEPQYPKTTSVKTLHDSLDAKGFTVQMAEVDPLETAEPGQLDDLAWYEQKMRGSVEDLARKLP